MTATILNIHEFYNGLKKAGFNEEQAEVIANIQGKTASATLEQIKSEELATKADLSEAKFDIIKWIAAIVIGAGVAQIFAIMGLLKLLGKI
ncbi:MAG: hypothetical protein PHQ03_07535 [Methylococcales bacterium]|nr:hypothetical protein [Methylococcales bacterium]